jgi:hypothetical protein
MLWIFVGILMHVCVSFSVIGQGSVKPKKMTFSYVNHPVILAELIPIVRQAYATLGIETQFVEQPSDRNLRAIKKGLVDGDVVFSSLLVKNYPELLLIEPPLVRSIFLLLCQPQLPCNKTILSDPTKLIASTGASQNGLMQTFGKQLKVHFYLINNLAIIPQLITEKRFDYGVYVMNATQLEQVNPNDFHYSELFRSDSFHILHPKYAFLKADVEGALRQVMAKSQH